MEDIRVSLVIPNYNGRPLLAKHLPAVLRALAKVKNSEVIVVDDASSDDSVAFLRKNFPQVKVVVHRKNKRFAATCNTGVERAKGDIVVLLNNDVSPQMNFLGPLLKPFANPQVFSVGCKERSVEGGRVVYSGRSEGKFERGFLVHWRAKDQNKKDTLWTAGGSMAVDRKKWLELGGMDLLFSPAYWEDIDLCWRARKKGYKILFAPEALVFHQHETTNIATFGKRKMRLFAFKNQFLFVWKNGDARMLLAHFLWLPYHLIRAFLTGEWLFFQGFLLALKQITDVLKSRKQGVCQ